MAATAHCTSFVCTSYDVVVFLLMAGSESAHSYSSVYPGLGSIYFRFPYCMMGPFGRVTVDFY